MLTEKQADGRLHISGLRAYVINAQIDEGLLRVQLDKVIASFEFFTGEMEVVHRRVRICVHEPLDATASRGVFQSLHQGSLPYWEFRSEKFAHVCISL